jgi:hypothetical protein
MSKLQEKPSSLKREHPALQKMKFINFYLSLWAIFALLDLGTDPGTPVNPDPIRIRIRIRIHNTGCDMAADQREVYHRATFRPGHKVFKNNLNLIIIYFQETKKAKNVNSFFVNFFAY